MTRRQRSRRARAFLAKRDAGRIRRASFAYNVDGSLEFASFDYREPLFAAAVLEQLPDSGDGQPPSYLVRMPQ